jgi:hypothetical protein
VVWIDRVEIGPGVGVCVGLEFEAGG